MHKRDQPIGIFEHGALPPDPDTAAKQSETEHQQNARDYSPHLPCAAALPPSDVRAVTQTVIYIRACDRVGPVLTMIYDKQLILTDLAQTINKKSVYVTR